LGARRRIEVGPVAILVAGVAPPARAAERPRLDRRTVGYAVLSAGVHAALLLLFVLIPASARGMADDELGRQLRATRTSFRPAEERPAAGAPAPPGADGERGRPEASERGRGKVKKVAETPSLAPPSDRVERARSAGVLGVMSAQRDALAALEATGDFTSGLDDADIRGSWMAPSFADSRGWGSGLHGPG